MWNGERKHWDHGPFDFTVLLSDLLRGKSEDASRHLKLASVRPYVVHYVGDFLNPASAGETFGRHHSDVPERASVKIYSHAGEIGN